MQRGVMRLRISRDSSLPEMVVCPFVLSLSKHSQVREPFDRLRANGL